MIRKQKLKIISGFGYMYFEYGVCDDTMHAQYLPNHNALFGSRQKALSNYYFKIKVTIISSSLFLNLSLTRLMVQLNGILFQRKVLSLCISRILIYFYHF